MLLLGVMLLMLLCVDDGVLCLFLLALVRKFVVTVCCSSLCFALVV